MAKAKKAAKKKTAKRSTKRTRSRRSAKAAAASRIKRPVRFSPRLLTCQKTTRKAGLPPACFIALAWSVFRSPPARYNEMHPLKHRISHARPKLK